MVQGGHSRGVGGKAEQGSRSAEADSPWFQSGGLYTVPDAAVAGPGKL